MFEYPVFLTACKILYDFFLVVPLGLVGFVGGSNGSMFFSPDPPEDPNLNMDLATFRDIGFLEQSFIQNELRLKPFSLGNCQGPRLVPVVLMSSMCTDNEWLRLFSYVENRSEQEYSRPQAV